MYLIIGKRGYISNKLQNYFLKKVSEEEYPPCFFYVLSPKNDRTGHIDYNKIKSFIFNNKHRLDGIINCFGYTGKPNVDACESIKEIVLEYNAVFPAKIARYSQQYDIPFLHISTGCLYTGQRVFSEQDVPNFCIGGDSGEYSWYSATKEIGEKMLLDLDKVWSLRIRMPFDQHFEPKNYLYKILTYDTLIDIPNSLTNINDLNRCIEHTLINKIPYGVYNIVNSGSVNSRKITELFDKHGIKKQWKFFDDYDNFNKIIKTPRSNCILSNYKILNTGIELDHVEESIEKMIIDMKPEIMHNFCK